MSITELQGIIVPVAILIANEIAHALRDNRERRERLAHQAPQNRVQATSEIFRTISQDFYRLFDHERPEEIAAIAHELGRNLRRVTLANAAIIGETIEKQMHSMAKSVEWLEAKAERCIQVNDLGGEEARKALEVFRSEIIEDIETVNLCKDALKKMIRIYTGDDLIDKVLKKAARPTIPDRLHNLMNKHRRQKAEKKKAR